MICALIESAHLCISNRAYVTTGAFCAKHPWNIRTSRMAPANFGVWNTNLPKYYCHPQFQIPDTSPMLHIMYLLSMYSVTFESKMN